MSTSQQSSNHSKENPDWLTRLRSSKALLPVIALLGITVAALSATLIANYDSEPQGTVAFMKDKELENKAALAKDKGNAGLPTQAPVPAVKRTPVAVTAPKAAVCLTCGTVESVLTVQRQGQVNGVEVGGTTVGIGTVAGGVVGGLLGNQVGGGNGKTAMTVIGVAGGALAGNTIEKNMKKVTLYQMRVRMNDGSVRTIEQSSAVPAGSRVLVEGNAMRLAPG